MQASDSSTIESEASHCNSYIRTRHFLDHKTRTSKLIVFVILLLLPAAEVCEAREPVGEALDPPPRARHRQDHLHDAEAPERVELRVDEERRPHEDWLVGMHLRPSCGALAACSRAILPHLGRWSRRHLRTVLGHRRHSAPVRADERDERGVELAPVECGEEPLQLAVVVVHAGRRGEHPWGVRLLGTRVRPAPLGPGRAPVRAGSRLAADV